MERKILRNLRSDDHHAIADDDQQNSDFEFDDGYMMIFYDYKVDDKIDYDNYNDDYGDDYDNYDDKPPWGWAPVALRCKSPPTLKVEPA